MSSEARIEVACPKCHTRYQVRAGSRGRITCRKCGAVFELGASGGGRGGRKAGSGSTQQQTAVRAIVASIVVLGVAGLVVFATSKRQMMAPPDPNRGQNDRARAERPEDVPKSPEPRRLADRFLRALASEDAAAMREMFLFEDYNQQLAWTGGWAPDDAKLWSNLDAAGQEEFREAVVANIQYPELVETIRTYLIPDLDQGKEKLSKNEINSGSATFDYDIRDDRGRPLLTISIGIRLRDGMDAMVDGGKPGAWGIYRYKDQYQQSTLSVPRPDRGMMDIFERADARAKAKERATRPKGPRGPAEADPKHVDPIEGTSPELARRIEEALRIVLNPESPSRKIHAAHDEIVALQKVAIPFLLNVLVGKNHVDGEQDIKDSNQAVQLLRDITRQQFGYGPMSNAANAMGMGLAGATAEQRETAVRRWFGWWEKSGPGWTGPPEVPEEEEG